MLSTVPPPPRASKNCLLNMQKLQESIGLNRRMMEPQPSVKLLPAGSAPTFSAVNKIEQKREQSSGHQHAKHRTLIKVPLTKEKE